MSLESSDDSGKREGNLKLIIGPMYSRKTSTLADELCLLADTNHKVLYINHVLDVDRETANGNKYFSTHNSQLKTLSSAIDTCKTAQLSELNVKDLQQYDTIGIDEGQFFPDLTIIRKWVYDYNMDIIVAGLKSDSDLKPFGQIHELLCISNDIINCTALCMNCLNHNYRGRPKRRAANYSFCFSAKKNQVEVGSNDKYIAVCMPCHKLLTDWKKSDPAQLLKTMQAIQV